MDCRLGQNDQIVLCFWPTNKRRQQVCVDFVNLHITAATVAGVLCCVTGSKRGVALSVNDKTFANEHGACAAA